MCPTLHIALPSSAAGPPPPTGVTFVHAAVRTEYDHSSAE